MRFFISFVDQSATKRTTRITIQNCTSTSILIKEICKEIRMPKTQIIIKLKNQPHNLRLVQNLPLDIYNINNGSMFIVEFIETYKNDQGPLQVLYKIEEQIDDSIQQKSQSSISRNQINESDYIQSFESDLQQVLNAVRNGQLELLSMIIKKQPAIQKQVNYDKIMKKKLHYVLNQAGQCGRNALHWAIHTNNADMVSFLIIKGANPTILTIDEYSPLQLAVLHRSPIIMNLLLQQKKIDINQVTKNGSALHLSMINQDMKCFQILIKHEDIDIDVVNYEGKSPIDLCRNQKIKQLLMKKAQMKKINIPNISKGVIYSVSSTWYRLRERDLVINPFKNLFTISELSGNTQSQQILTNIRSIQKIQQKTMMMKESIHYFRLNMKQDKQYLFGLRNLKIYKKWIDSFKNALRYIEFSFFIKDIPHSQQIIVLLNDQKNQITFHKRKIDLMPKKTLSIMNLKPFNVQEQINENNNKSNKLKKTNDNSSEVQSQDSQQRDITIGSMLEIGSVLTQSNSSPSRYNSSFQQTSIHSLDSSSSKFRKNSEQRYETISQFKMIKDNISYQDFIVKNELGNGAFGHVYLVQYKRNKKFYALKVLNKKKLIMKKHLKYAVSETNILKKVNNPFIINLYFAFQTPTNIYMVLDHCNNGDLSELIYSRQKLSQQTSRFIIAQLILAVQYLHKNRILYRDLKPENILIGNDGYIRLTDFGLSRENSFSMSFCGSPAYLSPEMLEKKGVGFSSDIYGIGCVLYEMVMGMPPFFDQSIEVLYENIKTGKLRFPSFLSIQIKSLISKLLERDLSKRIGVNNFNQIKNHDFFKKFDWKQLQLKKMKSPKQLYENQTNDNFFEQVNLQDMNTIKLVDNDYNESTKMINRIKNFTFIRQDQL